MPIVANLDILLFSTFNMFLCIFYPSLYIFMANFIGREDACKVLVDVYGANIDMRDYSGKKAFYYLKRNHKHIGILGVWLNYKSRISNIASFL